MSLRSILGGSNRVKKSSKPRNSSRSSPSSSWADSLPRSKPGSGAGSRSKKAARSAGAGDDDEDLFGDRLDDCGLVRALATDLTLRDVVQAMRYARDRMFTPMPEAAGGMNSTRTAEVLNFRQGLPPVVTTAHLHALLVSPTAAERETDELIRAGALRRIVVPRRGGVGEVLVQVADLEALLRASTAGGGGGGGVGAEARGALLAFLREEPAAQRVPRARLTAAQSDQLVRAGFLTAHLHHDVGAATGFARPEDRATMVSLERVAQAASGSYGAVGGQGALHAAGGTGGGSYAGGGGGGSGAGDMALTVPGLGAFLKLASAALAHLTGLLAKSPHKEASETMLRERWDGGVASDEARSAARRGRGEFAGVPPGRTRKWKEFYGLSFEWVLCEAVGAGLIEVFETRSVGRGVRLL
ncbi:Serine-threonine protein kinase 19-domain-containing protein [Pleurostoma richardsiae]|uniref:Serine-threonine protein kinase 19-domain-containing protein n=1 Tax=Pleurostoma richardsiae TaxID=41990 RepID=A0AA38VR06_9PEZI|nr:Serine-threonine protein kinase 19-domain-containing protein [Pleurostoma richardsiae]